MITKWHIFWIVVVLTAGLYMMIHTTSCERPAPVVVVEDSTYHHILANEIDDHFRRIGRNTSSRVIYSLISEAATELNSKFPAGEFDLVDILTIAAMESRFNEKSIGRFNEKGLFQILDSTTALAAIGHPDGNPYDPQLNTRMGLYVLSTKYNRYKDRKKAIISYNGVVITESGWCEDYWNEFVRVRRIISEIVRKANHIRST